jgi:hypothetical protein
MAISEQKLGILAERHFRIQIGDTPCRSETLVSHDLQRFNLEFNRTAVMPDINENKLRLLKH